MKNVVIRFKHVDHGFISPRVGTPFKLLLALLACSGRCADCKSDSGAAWIRGLCKHAVSVSTFISTSYMASLFVLLITAITPLAHISSNYMGLTRD